MRPASHENSIRTLLFATAIGLSNFCASTQSTAATGYGRAVQIVLPTFAVQVLNELVFMTAEPGAGDAVIYPSSPNAGFVRVQTSANQAFAILLPEKITLSIGSGRVNERIVIKNFASAPANTGVASSDGSLTLSIGATRLALSKKQKGGVYSGAYTIAVVY